MLRICCYTVVTALMFLPASVMAGGLPFLCLPVDGVDPDNVKACSDLLNSKLDSQALKVVDNVAPVQLIERNGQWYVTLYMNKDVHLSDINAALESKKCAVPQDRLHLFGHVLLEIETRGATKDQLLADLESLDNVSVDESETAKDRLIVTVDMPYPTALSRAERESLDWDKFRRNDLSSTTESREPITADKLPTYKAFQQVVSKHDAKLKDIHWSVNHACRVLGGVAIPDSKAKPAQVRSTKK